MRTALRALTSGALFALGLAAGTAASPAPGLALSACELEHPLRLTVVPAECGTLAVREGSPDSVGRVIFLRVARVPAISRSKRADPLFVLAGGPGFGAGDLYAAVAPAFARIHRDRDIVLIDQRGTGRSHPLKCPFSEEDLYSAPGDQAAREMQRCLAELAPASDVAWFTTSVAVQDLERVRAALGYPRIDLYGASYGTRVAQHYLRRFPQRTRTVVLDGVVPPRLAIGPEMALNAQRALDSILSRCARAPDCRAHFGDPNDAYRALRLALDTEAVAVNLPDPTTGQPLLLKFTAQHLAGLLLRMSYQAEHAALLPLLLHEAHERHDYRGLAAQYLLAGHDDRLLATGMAQSVLCAEDVPFYDPGTIDRAQLSRTFLGTQQVDNLISVCRFWPRGPIDRDFHAPLKSEVPVLLLSGSDDPVTPAAYAEEARRGFAHSRHVVLQGFGHGQLTAPCVDRLMAEFLERASVEGLDVSCVHAARPQAFFTSLNGPPP
ncbi:MAG TPA: alpha/beta hydrolase [Steroidobacteraceae bacterium]